MNVQVLMSVEAIAGSGSLEGLDEMLTELAREEIQGLIDLGDEPQTFGLESWPKNPIVTLYDVAGVDDGLIIFDCEVEERA